MDVICDVDGTVADLNHRRHYLDQKPKNWKKFYGHISNDIPIKPVIETIQSLYVTGHRIIFCTGRPEDYRAETTAWLSKNVILPKYLYMRAKNDFRDDATIKYELLQQIRADGFDPVIAFDDRDRVVKMWREQGLICAQVNEGDFYGIAL
jgi:hypothetical protein